MPEPLIEIRNLRVSFAGQPVVRGIDLDIRQGECLALVGESGSGKSVTAHSILQLLPPSSRTEGSIRLRGEELLGVGAARLGKLRGNQVAMIFQEPMSSLNPLHTIERQLSETLRLHTALDGHSSGLNWFPLRGLVSENFASLSTAGKVLDYLKHLVLPVTALVVGGFATLTMLTKNSFLDEMSRQYVITARAKGAGERQVLYGHVLRNAMLMVVAGLPQAMVSVFFGGSLLIEVVFSLDGLGRMSYDAAVSRDYPVVFGSLFIFTLFGLLIKLLGDLCYRLIDPRIDFSTRRY